MSEALTGGQEGVCTIELRVELQEEGRGFLGEKPLRSQEHPGVSNQHWGAGWGGVSCCLATPNVEEPPLKSRPGGMLGRLPLGLVRMTEQTLSRPRSPQRAHWGKRVLFPRAGLNLGLVSRDLEILHRKLKGFRTQEKLLSLFTVEGSWLEREQKYGTLTAS